MVKIIKQPVFEVTYDTKSSTGTHLLVEANSMEECLEIFREFSKEDPYVKIKGIHTYIPILKPLSKSVTQTITVEI